MRILRAILLIICVITLSQAVEAQRRVTPVKAGSKNITGVNENKQSNDSINRSKLVSLTDEQGNTVMVDTVTGKEIADTAALADMSAVKKHKMICPLLFNTSVGVDIWDPLMRIFGQSYGLIGFSAELNLHNRYIPVFEAGLGCANSTPTNQNYTFHVGVSPYFRIGGDYNFLYNKNPDYRFVAGLRLGWTCFSYQLRDVMINDPYWSEPQIVDFPSQTSSVTYLNVVFGLRVKIWKPISMGWNIRFRALLHETEQAGGKPSYIPGYGSRNGLITGSFSIYYTFSLSGRKKPEIALPPGFELESGERTPDNNTTTQIPEKDENSPLQ